MDPLTGNYDTPSFLQLQIEYDGFMGFPDDIAVRSADMNPNSSTTASLLPSQKAKGEKGKLDDKGGKGAKSDDKQGKGPGKPDDKQGKGSGDLVRIEIPPDFRYDRFQEMEQRKYDGMMNRFVTYDSYWANAPCGRDWRVVM